jgi:hypothetical protein
MCLVASVSTANTLASSAKDRAWSKSSALKLDKRIGQHAYLARPRIAAEPQGGLATVCRLPTSSARRNVVQAWIANNRHPDWAPRAHREVLHESMIRWLQS